MVRRLLMLAARSLVYARRPTGCMLAWAIAPLPPLFRAAGAAFFATLRLFRMLGRRRK